MENYKIRNVSEREIYDSYMGIMRISPNPMSDSNDKLIDDPTQHLNSILNVDPLHDTQRQMEITLSDSDGNKLPITFLPKCRISEVMVCKGSTKFIEKSPIINIVTKIEEGSKLFASNSFTSYSTIYLDNNEDNDKLTGSFVSTSPLTEVPQRFKISPLQVLTKENLYEKILLYPIESPHDEDYFNDKNVLNLIDYNSSKDKKLQLEENLLTKRTSWYETHNNLIEPERVKVGEKLITTHNNYGEIIPILKTRDYVLGHYEGHVNDVDETNWDAIKTNWIGTNSKLYNRPDVKNITKLSWLRFDDLVWNVVDNVLKGEIRHQKGRYKKMGLKKTDDIMETLFGGNGVCTIDDSNKKGDWINVTAPLLGEGVQKGLILHNAISFRRYMFHAVRQMCSNMEHQFKKASSSSWKVNEEGWEDFNRMAEIILSYKDNKLVSSAPQGSISPIQSIVKDFLLCDGKEINYKNYPNLNLRNKDIFQIDDDKIMPEAKSNFTFEEIGIDANVKTVKDAIYFSNKNQILETPHLYSIIEQSPRLIRALNWSIVADENNETAVNMGFSSDEYTSKIINENKTPININGDEITEDEDGNKTDNRAMGEGTSNVIKNIKDVGLYFHNYDNLIKRDDHYHASFSPEDGLNSIKDEDPNEKENLSSCVSYQTGKKRNGKIYSVDHNTVLNHDLVYLGESKDNSKNWVDYCFNKNVLYKYNGYAPIPNAGLFLFNFSMFNMTGEPGFAGTTKYIEDEIRKGNYVYYDGYGNSHTMVSITPVEDLLIKFKTRVYEELMTKNIDKYPSYQTLEDFLNDETINPRKIFEMTKNEMSFEDKQSLSIIFREVYSIHMEEKNMRRLQLVKINESEGRIPAASSGGPLYQSWVNWSRTERRNCKKRRRKEYNFKWKAVGNYKIGVNNNRNEEDSKSLYRYRCLTSIPYQNPQKLGAGDVNGDLSDDYYNKNSVTSSLDDIVYQDVSYGGVTISGSEIDRSAPSPEFVNLLPLIRI